LVSNRSLVVGSLGSCDLSEDAIEGYDVANQVLQEGLTEVAESIKLFPLFHCVISCTSCADSALKNALSYTATDNFSQVEDSIWTDRGILLIVLHSRVKIVKSNSSCISASINVRSNKGALES